MIKNLVSVVMPTYNDAKYLKVAISDILNQTYSNFELIIVNDGSTDETEQILNRYVGQDDRIRVFHKENGGTGSALNYGFKYAKGEFGTWISSDDRRPKNYIERLVEALEKTKTELVFSSYYSEKYDRAWRSYVLDDSGENYIVNRHPFYHNMKSTKKIIVVTEWVDINLYMCHSGVSFIFTMDLKNRSGDYLTIPGEDYHMEVKMAIIAKDNRVAYIDEVLGWHRSPPDSLTNLNPTCVFEAEKITKQMILDWKRTGNINA